MVGAGPESSEAPSMACDGRGASIPLQHLRRVLLDNMQTPPMGASSFGRGRGRRGVLEVDVAAGEVGRLLRLPCRHPQLIHPTTRLLRLR